MAVPKVLEELLEAGSHFGHQVRRWNPKMAPFIYSSRDGVHVFDLTITAQKLEEACEVIKDAASKGMVIVFIGTKRQAKAIIREEAGKVKAPYIAERWMGGMITNWEQIKKRIDKMNKMGSMWDSGGYDKYTKKERVLINREMERLDRFFGGIATLSKIPDMLFIVDTAKEKVPVKEANQVGMPIVAMIDSNCDPEDVTYPIPANDDAVRSIKYVVSRVADAYGEGRSLFEKNRTRVGNETSDNKKN